MPKIGRDLLRREDGEGCTGGKNSARTPVGGRPTVQPTHGPAISFSSAMLSSVAKGEPVEKRHTQCADTHGAEGGEGVECAVV